MAMVTPSHLEAVAVSGPVCSDGSLDTNWL
jgi:hypothetical protein